MSGVTQLELKSFWTRYLPASWIWISVLAVVLGIPRFIWLLGDHYNFILIIFVIMWLLPFVFLTRNGRRQMGIQKPFKPAWLLYGFLIGVFSSVIIYYIGLLAYGHTLNNWYVTIMNSFNKDDMISDIKIYPLVFFIITIPTMIFSPIGEEFFFRGMMQNAFAEAFGNKTATFVEASFFGITHLAHHGLILEASGIRLLPSFPIWIILMTGVSYLLAFTRNKAGSIWGAVVCHSGFNFGMMFCIFYLLHE